MSDIESIKTTMLETKASTNIACIQLNKPKALNALDITMVKAMLMQLQAWRNDDSIAAVFIDSSLEKAFCAGGDIVSMYTAMANEAKCNPGNLPDFMRDFFASEYSLDYCLHVYPKPVIAWGSGIIMGGGLGVFAGSHFKIVSETARVAMPEISIGLFPDVGASYFLNKMPKGVGKFLGLSAANINAQDCIDIGLASHLILNQDKSIFLQQIQALNHIDKRSIGKVCDALHRRNDARVPDAMITPILKKLEVLDNLDTLAEIEQYLQSLNTDETLNSEQRSFLQKALNSYSYGSPITAKLVLEQLSRSENLSLADCFRMELSMAYACSVNGEFQEGVRALLIDKDKSPKWQYQCHTDIPQKIIENHFSYLYNNKIESLVNLEQQFGAHNG